MALKLTDEQAEDFTVLAEALAANKGNNEIIHDIGAKYKDFVSRNKAVLPFLLGGLSGFLAGCSWYGSGIGLTC